MAAAAPASPSPPAVVAAESPRSAARRERRDRRRLRLLLPTLLAFLLQASPRGRDVATDWVDAALVALHLREPEVPPGPPAEAAFEACSVCQTSSASLLRCAAGAARDPAPGRPPVALVMRAPPDAAPWTAVSVALAALYAQRHGYALRVPTEADPPQRHASWAKVALLRRYLQPGSGFEAVFYLEPSVLLIGHDTSLDFMLTAELSPGVPKELVAFEADAADAKAGAVADTAALLVRATPFMRRLLMRWWRAAGRLRAAEALAAGSPGGFKVTDVLALDAMWRSTATGIAARSVLLPRRQLTAGAPLWARPPGWALDLAAEGEFAGVGAAAEALRWRVARAALKAACGEAPRLDAAALRRTVQRAHNATVERNADADEVAAAQHALGRIAAANQEWGPAVQALRAAAAAWPHRADVAGALGSALSGSGEHAEAVIAFRTAVALAPRDAPAHSRLAAALLAAALPRQAAVAAAAALTLAPEDAAALSVRCIALRQVGDPEHAAEADAACARVAERQPRIARRERLKG